MTTRELMTRALELAREAAAAGEVPVGAVIAKDGEIITAGRNRVEELKSPLAHAEIVAIDSALRRLDTKFLTGCDLIVTLEPCPMCAGAIINSRIKRLVFGAYDEKAGSVFSVQEMFRLPYNHAPEVQAGFMERECAALLTEFFANLRNGG
ncbi:MAG: nucleoside deaminase [Clostridia bacterium]|nr:nucleoside deaminase [Clostridia bacterium]